MLIDRFALLESEGRGKGLFATTHIPAGTVVGYFCEKCTLMHRDAYLSLSLEHRKSLKLHSYIDKEGHLRTDCGLARYMNHSCKPNVLSAGNLDIAIRDIQSGDEVFYDYRVFYDEEWDCFHCRCGHECCCGLVQCTHPIPEQLQLQWSEEIAIAFRLAAVVPQPLPEAKKLLLASPYNFRAGNGLPVNRVIGARSRRKSVSMKRKMAG